MHQHIQKRFLSKIRLRTSGLFHISKMTFSIRQHSMTSVKFDEEKLLNTTCDHCSNIVQIGNPILRQSAKEVKKGAIKSDYVQDVIKKLETMMEKYDALGFAAPQIGIGLKIAIVYARPD